MSVMRESLYKRFVKLYDKDMNPPGSWCERPKRQAPSCELPSPWSKPKQPGNWCEAQKDPVLSALDFLLRVAKR
jgi:hypothetical protein